MAASGQALTNIDGILELSGSLMVARGDLGVELGHARVPFAQKLLVAASKKKGVYPCIVATQVISSVGSGAFPARPPFSGASTH